MNAERLLAHYERIADAPDSVGRLRRFIRDLAVRGKLVPQDAKDETVSSTLRRRNFNCEADGPFEIPSTWVWVSVGAIAEARLGKMLDKAKNKGTPRRYLRNVNVRWFDFDLSDVLEMRFEDSELPEFALKSGDVLICEGGEPGRAAVWDERETEVYFQKAIHRVRFSGLANSHYFVNTLRASAEDGRLSESFTGTGIKHFTGKELRAYQFPLPPLAEQHRIVAKVDELMTLCDRLEAARVEREAKRDRLTASSLARLNAPDPESFQDDARFVLSALPAFTRRPDQIKQIRQTILNLAVRGKLVLQDPKDEPARELLTQIAKEKVELVKAGGLKKAEPVDDLIGADQSFRAPHGWRMSNLKSVCLSVTDGDHLPPPKAESGIPFLVIGNVRSQRIDFSGSRFVPQEYYEALDPIRRPKCGDLLYTLVGSYGIPVVVRDDQPFCVQRHIGILRPSKFIDVSFLELSMGSRFAFDQATACATGIAQKTVSLFGLRNLVLPIPPLAEQHRIVAKVEELMALCEQLEANLINTATIRSRLLDALLAGALSSDAIEVLEAVA